MFLNGHCHMHAYEYITTQKIAPTGPQLPKSNLCDIDGCTTVSVYKGLCKWHYENNPKHKQHGCSKTCSLFNCHEHIYAKNLCHGHYLKNRRAIIAIKKRACSVTSCDLKKYKSEYCFKHYNELKKPSEI